MYYTITIREYLPTDKPEIMKLIRLNTPTYFAPEEEAELNEYLEHRRELYYVMTEGKRIVGCGGINIADNGTTGRISWDIIHPAYHGKSLGSQLLQYRIKLLKADRNICRITVRTSQLVYRFYEKHGFVLLEVIQDYWAEGFDMYRMELRTASRR